MDANILQVIENTEENIKEQLNKISQIVTDNQDKVLNAFQIAKVGDYHFNPTTGYGYDDLGRDKLEEVYASVLERKTHSLDHRLCQAHMRSRQHFWKFKARGRASIDYRKTL